MKLGKARIRAAVAGLVGFGGLLVAPITVSAVSGPLAATATASTPSGQVPLPVDFMGSAAGGTPPYSYSWNFGDGSAITTAQNPSHTFTTAGTYTVTLTVTDSSSPANIATATVTIIASPIGGTVPSAPTGLGATAGSGNVTLRWAAPSSDGGEAITSYEVFRGTSSGTETYLTSGGCGSLGAVLTCTDTGLTVGQAYYYYVIAANAIGTGPQSNEASATPTAAATPTITRFTPTSGAVDKVVTIRGTNLADITAVKFKNTTATVIKKDTATKIKVRVPAGAESGKITVTTPGGTVISTKSFTVT